ncbi:hypothetical protein ACFL6E_05505 [Candidatus Neomarinimicrobiota bacterium]
MLATKLTRNMLAICLVGHLGLQPAIAQTLIPFDNEQWEINAQESRIEEHLAKPSLFIQGGHALLSDVQFLNGIIEFDIAFTGERGFMGTIWRVLPDGNYEEFYLRPHQSGNPDANQYNPVFNNVAGWQLYHGPGYGAPVEYLFNQWMHVKVLISDSQAEMYVMDMETPLVFVPELKHDPVSGQIGVNAGGYAGAWFSGFTFTALDEPKLVGEPQEDRLGTAAEGTIMSWQVSQTIAEQKLEGHTALGSEVKSSLQWQQLECEATGLANLARVNNWSYEENTAFARVIVKSSKKQVAGISFGYSDRVRVYCNDQRVYSGTNRYMTRDYRYLGTIGLFDEVYLPLKSGKNEIWFAVSEDFGGWGVMARLINLDGLEIIQ